MTGARAIIDRLALAPHPEGGWYRETWRAPAAPGDRAAGTAILFLLDAGQRSHWHRIDAAELWLWHAGAPLTLAIAPGECGPIDSILLGGALFERQAPQAIVPARHWQAAYAEQGWVLVSCVVVPGFDFAGFELADPGWSPGPI